MQAPAEPDVCVGGRSLVDVLILAGLASLLDESRDKVRKKNQTKTESESVPEVIAQHECIPLEVDRFSIWLLAQRLVEFGGERT
jgi:hypothetical protein